MLKSSDPQKSIRKGSQALVENDRGYTAARTRNGRREIYNPTLPVKLIDSSSKENSLQEEEEEEEETVLQLGVDIDIDIDKSRDCITSSVMTECRY